MIKHQTTQQPEVARSTVTVHILHIHIIHEDDNLKAEQGYDYHHLHIMTTMHRQQRNYNYRPLDEEADPTSSFNASLLSFTGRIENRMKEIRLMTEGTMYFVTGSFGLDSNLQKN